MTKDEALNAATQCRATASHPLTQQMLVDGGSGLLSELLSDAAKAIEALAQPVQPVQETNVDQEATPVQMDSCFCHDGVSLQMVSGGAAPEGYLGKVTLLIDGEYVDYAKAQPEEQEPVAWKLMPRDATDAMLKAMDECSTEGYDERLYAGHAASVYMAAWDASDTHPPQRTWVGLTDEDCKGMSAGDRVVAMWADRTLKEKNT